MKAVKIAAFIYAVLCGAVIAFQFALALGAPWGHLAMGGQSSGQFGAAMRFGAIFQALLLAGMATVVLARAGVTSVLASPRWLVWPVLGVTVLSMIANLLTPSAPERMLWGPVTIGMVICCLLTAFATRQN